MAPETYSPPLDRLLNYADCSKDREIPNYVEELQLTAEHIPDLIRMATDDDLLWAETESLEVWAPVHAWRALGQLRAEAAIEPLIGIFDALEDDDWAQTELPDALGAIGAAAIPPLSDYLANTSKPMSSRSIANNALEKIATEHPEARADVIAALMRAFEQIWKNPPTLNGFIMASLVELKAVEAAPLIEKGFRIKRIDSFVMGNWDDVQVELGLKTREEVPQREMTEKERREYYHYLTTDKPPAVGFIPEVNSKTSKKSSKKKKRK